MNYGEAVKPEHKDKYYVYALLRPNGIPFYIGKGIGNRINHHFQDCSLKKINRKNAEIKHYGHLVRREILAYLNDEQSAYDLEEDLILSYGLLNDGGCLANHLKGRYDPNASNGDDGKNVGGELSKKYSDNLVREAFRIFYTEDVYPSEVAKRTGINSHYILGILSGRKRKDLFLEAEAKFGSYPKEKRERHFSEQSQKPRQSSRVLSDETLLGIFEIWNSKAATLLTLAKQYGVSKQYLSSVMRGESRGYLGIADSRRTKRKVIDEVLFEKIFKLRAEGHTHLEISSETGIHKSSLHRILTNKENIERFSQSNVEGGLNGT